MSVERTPTLAGAGVALGAALGAVAALVDAPRQLVPFAAVGVGLLVVGAGVALQANDRRIAGRVAALVGFGVGLAGLGLAASVPGGLFAQVVLATGLLGAYALSLGLYPVRRAWSRPLAVVGTALLVGAAALDSVLHGIPVPRLLASVTAALVAWDAAERAITLGEQVGRRARTATVELLRGGATATVGALACVVSLAAFGATPAVLPTATLALLLAVALLATTSLFA
ncbi:DUF7519 family protein [Halomicrococcus gelatinilyticus]|uniref:DUF7519 family protein n=1 Tax=Halomicrococcus gelatinilyticus TaxID=1702103 RepID=UPI002E152B0E